MLLQKLFGMREASTPGSNARRVMARSTLFVALYALLERFGILPTVPAFGAYMAVIWSVVFFIVIVAWVVYLTTSSYPPDPVRLITDILTSGLLSITSFSLIYGQFGIVDTIDATAEISKTDYLYFSTVTFSTLGFGDFRPMADARLIAGSQAIIGNLHLGLLAGAAFYAVQQRISPTRESSSSSDQIQQDAADKTRKTDGTDDLG